MAVTGGRATTKRAGGWMLRAGRPADLSAMHALDLTCFEEPFRFDLKSMRRFALRAGAIVVVAVSGRELAGFAILHRERGRLAYVVTLDVAQAYRHAGLGRSLMLEVETDALQSDGDRIGLHVFTGNTAAVAFYERLGFERVELVNDFYGDGLHAWTYLKRLGAGQAEEPRVS